MEFANLEHAIVQLLYISRDVKDSLDKTVLADYIEMLKNLYRENDALKKQIEVLHKQMLIN